MSRRNEGTHPYSCYLITNLIDGMKYIGKTVEKNPRNRWSKHRYASEHRKNNNSYLYNAMAKYGFENFSFEVIAQCIPDEKILIETEILLIKQHETYYKFDKGYNMTFGGEGITGYRHTEETKKRNGDKSRGRKASPETRKRLREAQLGKEGYFKGKFGNESANAYPWEIIYDDYTIEHTDCLKTFANENDYNYKSLSNLGRGKQRIHKDIIGVKRLD